MTGPTALPNWVVKRDGRLVPFNGDKICLAIFAACEQLGRSDPLLARELTDGILHFLTADSPRDPLATADVSDVVAKTVRELGHPSLALAFEHYAAARSPRSELATDSDECVAPADERIDCLIASRPSAHALTRQITAATLESLSRRAVYSRDLLAAERDGLLHFLDSGTPLELAGAVILGSTPVATASDTGWVDALEVARERVGQFVAIDSPEHSLVPASSHRLAEAWVSDLRLGLRLTGLRAVVNLNCPAPPDNATGPLFVGLGSDGDRIGDLSDLLLDRLLDGGRDGVRVDWHLSDRDFEPARCNRLLRLARRILERAPLSFVPDPGRRPIALSEGLDRRHRTVLCVVGISLPKLAEAMRANNGSTIDPASYLTKLGSLARLALSAGQARRDFLRRQARPEVTRGFEIERARLVLTPLGLGEAVHQITGETIEVGSAGLEFTRQILQVLHAVVHHAVSSGLPACLDAVPPLARSVDSPTTCGTIRQQLRAAGILHTEAQAGTAVVHLPADHRPTPEDITHLLWYAWQQPGLTRVHFAWGAPVAKQLSAGWDIPHPQSNCRDRVITPLERGLLPG